MDNGCHRSTIYYLMNVEVDKLSTKAKQDIAEYKRKEKKALADKTHKRVRVDKKTLVLKKNNTK